MQVRLNFFGKQVNAAMLLILIIAGTVRFLGINFGLPHTLCSPDESNVVGIALRFGTGDLNPHFFNYPTLWMYVLFSFYIFYFLVGKITGAFFSKLDFAKEFISNPTNFYLISRCFSALLGTLSVIITYMIVKQLFNKRIATVSSLFLSLAYLHVRNSHFGVTDISVTFLILCSLFFIIRSYKNKKLHNYIFAGTVAGLATSTKYIGAMLCIPMFFGHGLNFYKQGIRKLLLDKRILLFLLCVIFVFLLGSPFVLIDFPEFLNDFLFEMREVQEFSGSFFDMGWFYHLRFSLFHGLGWSLLFASILGILILLKKDIKKAIILYSFPFIYYFIAGRGHRVFVRYMIPITPFLCIAGAICVVYIAKKLSKFFKPNKTFFRVPVENSITFALSILIMVPSIINISQFNWLLMHKDNRLLATEWVEENIQGGSSIYQTGALYGSLLLPETLESLQRRYQRIKHGESQDSFELEKVNTKIDYWVENNVEGYEQWDYDPGLGKFFCENEEKPGLPDYIFVQRYPLLRYTEISKGIEELIDRFYRIKKSFEAINVNDDRNVFDQMDAFFIPFNGYKNIKRPGPNIYIYENRNSLN